MKKTILLASLLIASLSVANGVQREMREPPQEAISACEGLNQKDTCSMTTPKGDLLEGTCQNTPDNKYFVCMPSRDHARPPREG